MVADRGRRIALGGTGAAPAAQRHARPRCRGSRWVWRRGHPLRLAARVRLRCLCAGLGAIGPGHRTFRNRRNRLAKRGVACCRGTHGTWRSTTIGDRWPRPTTPSQARGVRVLLRLPLYRKMVLLAMLILGSHAMHDSFAMIRWSRAGISPGTSGILWGAFGRRRGRRLPLGRPSFARPHRPGRRGDALRWRRCRALGSDGRDRVASSGGGERALARPNVRALASDMHAAFGTMRSKAPRGDSPDESTVPSASVLQPLSLRLSAGQFSSASGRTGSGRWRPSVRRRCRSP